jgi:hypothetical protein
LLTSDPRSISFVGLCTGIITAVGAAAEESLAGLISLCPVLIRVAFRMSIEAKKRANNLDSRSGSWAMVLKDCTPSAAKDMLEEFCSSNVTKLIIPVIFQWFIS